MLFRRIAGVSALVAVLVGGLSGVLFLAAGEFRLDSLLDPVRLLGVGSSRAQLLRWGALTDLLGYYLLLVPLVVCIGSELRPRGGPIVDLFTVAGVLYAAIGATAAVVLAEAGPVLLRAYDQADPAARGGIALAFEVLTKAVYKGTWQTLEVVPPAVWAAGTGVLLWSKRRMLGGIGITMGILGLVSGAVRMTQVEVATGPAIGYAALARRCSRPPWSGSLCCCFARHHCNQPVKLLQPGGLGPRFDTPLVLAGPAKPPGRKLAGERPLASESLRSWARAAG